MATLNFKNILFILLIGGIGVQTIISCTTNIEMPLPPLSPSSSSLGSGGVSSSSLAALSSGATGEYGYCVFASNKVCLDGPVSVCPPGGTVSNVCPYGGTSSGGSPSGISSSSGGINSSSSTISSSGNRSSSSGGGNITPGTGGPVSYYGKLKASGNKIVGSKTGSTAVQVRGVSLGWSNTGWESAAFFNAATVNAMVDNWKAEIIRVPMGYAASGAGEYGGSYLADKTGNMNRVKAAIDAAIAKDVYVIIDWHTHTSNSADASAYFEEMARLYGSYHNVIFEIFNEPLSVTWASIKTYANTVITKIRSYSDNLILVGTPNYDQDVSDVVGNTLTDGNVAYVVHFYAASHPLNGGSYTPNFASRINSVRSAGYPVFVSEYGTVSADGNGSHDASASNTWMTFLNSNNISYCAWHVNNKNEASAFFKPTFTPSASAGWATTSNMTASGQYIYSNLVSWSSNATWRGGSGNGTSSSGGSSSLYCDFGYPTTGGDAGCFPIDYASECDTEYGKVATSCGRTDLIYCDWGPRDATGGGCYIIQDRYSCEADYGNVVSKCPASSL